MRHPTNPDFHLRPLPLLAATLVLLVAPATWAGRGPPDPVLKQFAEGYGVVAAEVIEADKPPLEDDGTPYGTWGALCRVVSVPAETVRIHPRLNLKPGDSFTVRLHVGYGSEVEFWGGFDADGTPRPGEGQGPLDPGARFYLTIRPAGFGTFEHASGGDAARRVAKFDPATDTFYTRLHDTAALPFDRRWNAVLDTVGDTRADINLRAEVLNYLQNYFFANGELAPQYVALAKQHLWKLWRESQSDFDDDRLLYSLDRALQNFDWAGFTKSDERRRAWMTRIFAPFPPGTRPDDPTVRRRCAMNFVLEDLARQAPADIAARLIEELKRPDWPEPMHVSLTHVLFRLYLNADAPNPAAQATLQDAFEHWAAATTAPFDVRDLAATVKYAATADLTPAVQGPRRHFFIRPATRTLLAHRAALLRAQATPDDPDQSGLAAGELDAALTAQESAASAQRRP